MIAIFKRTFAFFMAILSFFFSPIFGKFGAKFEPKDKDNVKLNFSAFSDTHILAKDPIRMGILGMGLYDIEKASVMPDAVVVAGDITDHGYRDQWESVKDTFAKYPDLKNVILAIGNHDTWTEDDHYEKALALFTEYNKKISDRDIDHAYYSTKVNGYTFVVLGSENDILAADISDEQMDWFKNTMAEASRDGLPIFVICHQPLNQSHGLPETWGDKDPEPDLGGIGKRSDEVEAVMKSYKNVFFISGHIHSGIGDDFTEKHYGYRSVETDGSFHSINLPSYMYPSKTGELSNGMGFQFEVYEDNVVIRARCFTAGVWYTNHEYTIPLVK
ncbi:MAG: metallophosphoesterase [Clostridiales bacterium]|nr:metallophosphoesterase [Clostridiales bacterium]